MVYHVTVLASARYVQTNPPVPVQVESVSPEGLRNIYVEDPARVSFRTSLTFASTADAVLVQMESAPRQQVLADNAVPHPAEMRTTPPTALEAESAPYKERDGEIQTMQSNAVHANSVLRRPRETGCAPAWDLKSTAAAKQWNQYLENDRERAPGDIMTEWLQRQVTTSCELTRDTAAVTTTALQRGFSLSYEATADYVPLARDWLQQQVAFGYEASKATGARAYDVGIEYGPVAAEWLQRHAADVAAITGDALQRGAVAGYETAARYGPTARDWIQQRAVAGYETALGRDVEVCEATVKHAVDGVVCSFQQPPARVAVSHDMPPSPACSSHATALQDGGQQLTVEPPVRPPCLKNSCAVEAPALAMAETGVTLAIMEIPEAMGVTEDNTESATVHDKAEASKPSEVESSCKIACASSLLAENPLIELDSVCHVDSPSSPLAELLFEVPLIDADTRAREGTPELFATSVSSIVNISEAITASSHSRELKKASKPRKHVAPRRLICCRH